jgi:uncharacterized membrane protein
MNAKSASTAYTVISTLVPGYTIVDILVLWTESLFDDKLQVAVLVIPFVPFTRRGRVMHSPRLEPSGDVKNSIGMAAQSCSLLLAFIYCESVILTSRNDT